MPYESDAEAAEALFAATLEDGSARSDVQELHDQVQQVREENKPAATGDDSGATDKPDTFTGIDPNSLPEEVQPFYKSMQADYTRKLQEVAAERKAYEQLDQFGGAETALEAVNFANALATDPNYAMQVHGQLTEALIQAGLTPAQASQEAATQVQQAATPPAPQSDDFAFGEEDYSNSEVKQLEQRLSSMQKELEAQATWRKEQEQNAFNIQLANEMARQENTILSAHPEYGDGDLEKIYTLSYAYGGNLEQANEVYQQMQNDVISGYIAKKGQVAAGVQDIGGSGITPEAEPVKFDGLFDKNLDRLVRERLAQELAAE